MTDAVAANAAVVTETVVTALNAEGFKPDPALTPEQNEAARVTAEASAKAVEESKAADTAKAAQIAELEKNSKLAGDAGKKATDELKALRDADAAAALKVEADKKAAEDKAKGVKDDKAVGAPDKYEDFTLPEGMASDPETTEKFKATAKSLNLSQKQAQELVDLQTGLAAKANTIALEGMKQAWTATATKWVSEAKADPEIGGAKYDQTIADSKAFIKAFNPSPAFQKMLIDTGVGNHPEFMRLTSKGGQALKDDVLHGAERKTADAQPSLFPLSAPRT